MRQFWSGILTYVTPEILFLLPAQVCLLLMPARFAARLLSLAFFCVGHALVFIALAAGAMPAAQAAVEHQAWIARAGGLLMIAGGALSGRLWAALLGAFAGGATIASVWPPSSGPVLGDTMLLANSGETLSQGLSLLFMHALGFSLAFLSAGGLLDRLLSIPSLARWRGARAPGIVYAVMGLVALSGATGTVSLWLILRTEAWVDWLSGKGL